MGDIVNLRRAKKAKTRDQSEKDAAANRAKFGTAKTTRLATEQEKTRADRAIDSHRIEND